MLSLAKQHLQQHSKLAAKSHASGTSSSSSRSSTSTSAAKQQQNKKARTAELLSDFPLQLPSSPSSKKSNDKNAASSSSSAVSRSPSFTKQSTRRLAHAQVISTSSLRRAKMLQRKLPKPTLLERAERSLGGKEKSAVKEQEEKNLRMLTHQSGKKKQLQETMTKILLATTPKPRHASKEESEEEDNERDDFDDLDDDDLADLMD